MNSHRVRRRSNGQIVLDSALFAANRRPAVDVGLSVSRVGGKAQQPALRNAAGRLRLDYAQFLELEIFTRFGGLIDARVQAHIDRGERSRALFAQSRFSALRGIDEIALLAALSDGVFDRGADRSRRAGTRADAATQALAHRSRAPGCSTPPHTPRSYEPYANSSAG